MQQVLLYRNYQSTFSHPPVGEANLKKSQLSSELVPSSSVVAMKDTRLAFRRRHSYNTKSNKTRVVKTPGGK